MVDSQREVSAAAAPPTSPTEEPLGRASSFSFAPVAPERIVVVSTSYPSDAADPSGHFVRTEAFDLARQGARVHVLAPRAMREPTRVGADFHGSLTAESLGGADLFAWPGAVARARQNPLRLAHVATVGIALRRALLRLGSVDRAILHFIVPVAFPLVPSLASIRSIEVVAHGADVRLLLAAPRIVRARVLSTLLDRGAQFRFVARDLLDRLTAALPFSIASRLESVSSVRALAIELPPRDELAPPERPEAFERYAVWVGRDVPTKRLDLALAAAARAGVPLVVVGAHETRPSGLGAPSLVRCLGPVPRPEALRWIAHAHLLLSTSSEEGAPTAIREARALGVPVVACLAGDIAAWARSDAGLVVAQADAAKLAKAISEVASRRRRAHAAHSP